MKVWGILVPSKRLSGSPGSASGEEPPENEFLFFLYLYRYLAKIPQKIMILHIAKKGAIALRPRKKVI